MHGVLTWSTKRLSISAIHHGRPAPIWNQALFLFPLKKGGAMKGQILLAGCFVLVMAASAEAQTKLSATLTCNKPEPVYRIEVGDRPGHEMVLEKAICTYTKPWDIDGDKSKEGVSVVTIDVSATRLVSNGTHVTTMESGDKTFAAIRAPGA